MQAHINLFELKLKRLKVRITRVTQFLELTKSLQKKIKTCFPIGLFNFGPHFPHFSFLFVFFCFELRYFYHPTQNKTTLFRKKNYFYKTVIRTFCATCSNCLSLSWSLNLQLNNFETNQELIHIALLRFFSSSVACLLTRLLVTRSCVWAQLGFHFCKKKHRLFDHFWQQKTDQNLLDLSIFILFLEKKTSFQRLKFY